MKSSYAKIFSPWTKASFALLIFLLGSCEEAIDWEFQPGENGRLVVESILTDELKRHEVLLSLTYDDFNGTAPAVSGAQVAWSNGQNTIKLNEAPDEPGLYRSPIAFTAKRNTEYQLSIEWEGQNYEANASMATVRPPGQGFTFGKAGARDSMKINQTPPLYAPEEQAMYWVEIDWSHLTTIEPTRAETFYYTFRTVDVSQLFRPQQEEIVFPRGSIFRVTKYGLSEDFADYYRALVMEKEWQGGVYEEVSDNLPTNISNGGLGFFGVSAVWKDSLIVQ